MDESAEHQRESFPQEQPSTPTEAKKERSGKHSVSSLVPAIVWLTTIFFIGMVLGNILWLFVADVLAFGREDTPVEFVITEQDSLKDISIHLKQQGLISYPGLFRLYSKISGKTSRIQPGTYALNARYDYHALIKALSSGAVQRAMPAWPPAG